METNFLTESDYTKILSFIAQTKKSQNDYQQHVLTLLNEIFGYNHTTFNLINNKLEVFNSRLFNLAESSNKSYYEYYYKTDIFNPKIQANLMISKDVISITDIMPTSQFENTEFYLDFLKKDMLYYELVLPLKADNKLIGAVGIYKEKDENNFSNKDLVILNRLTEFIASDLLAYLDYTNTLKNCQTYNNCFDESSTGIIILDRNFSIISYNRAAEASASKLHIGNSPYSSIQQFIYKVISEYSHEINNPHQVNIKFFYKTFFINIVARIIPSICEGMEYVYLMFITEESGKKYLTDNNPRANYNLTARETEILELVKNGLSNEEIADNLYISSHTVKTHMGNIFQKLQVKNRTAALHRINSPTEKH